MNTYPTPLLDRIAARRSAAEPSGLAVAQSSAPRVARPPARAPFVPEWRRRAIERVEQMGRIAVLDTTDSPTW